MLKYCKGRDGYVLIKGIKKKIAGEQTLIKNYYSCWSIYEYTTGEEVVSTEDWVKTKQEAEELFKKKIENGWKKTMRIVN